MHHPKSFSGSLNRISQQSYSASPLLLLLHYRTTQLRRDQGKGGGGRLSLLLYPFQLRCNGRQLRLRRGKGRVEYRWPERGKKRKNGHHRWQQQQNRNVTAIMRDRMQKKLDAGIEREAANSSVVDRERGVHV